MIRCIQNCSLLLAVSLLVACGDKDKPATDGPPKTDSAPKATGPSADSQDPKDAIAYQFGLLKAGDVDKLKACFTARLQDSITADAVEKGKGEAGSMTLDDLVASVEEGEYEGKKTAKIKMKNGRTLTTLIMTDGKWLADTVGFK